MVGFGENAPKLSSTSQLEGIFSELLKIIVGGVDIYLFICRDKKSLKSVFGAGMPPQPNPAARPLSSSYSRSFPFHLRSHIDPEVTNVYILLRSGSLMDIKRTYSTQPLNKGHSVGLGFRTSRVVSK
jgi:hypothetical protein